jgi:hypothetical protein
MSDPAIIGVDCDLHKLYAWDSTSGLVCKAEPSILPIVNRAAEYSRVGKTCLVLFEIAGQPYANKFTPGAMRNWTRWAEFNVASAFRLECRLAALPRVSLLVATSDRWTKGHELHVRHAVAKCRASSKDVREAEAMVFYYKNDPSRWQTVDQYMEAL